MSCTKNQLPRPVRGNAFNIAVKVVARRLDGTVIDDFELSSDDVLNIVYRGTLTPTAFTIEENNVALIHFDGTQPAGMYGVDFGGVWNGEPWRFALPIIFQVVDQTSQGWLPKDGIIVDPTYEVVASITIATAGSTVQADWDETDPDAPAYIKNKPSVYTQQQTDALVALERQARQQADTTLNGKITANTNAIAAEKSRAEAAEQGLQTAIGAEEARAKAAEKQNADDIDDIEAVIPAQASAQNQLADKNFVNSSISTNTANFVGTYNSLAELQAVQNPTNNDYGFVIEHDAAGNEYYDRYKYVASSQQWLFEYKVESTPFTAAQWAAIQSGITSALVTKLSALPTNAELQQALTLINTTLAGKANSADLSKKQDVLTADGVVRINKETGTDGRTFILILGNQGSLITTVVESTDVGGWESAGNQGIPTVGLVKLHINKVGAKLDGKEDVTAIVAPVNSTDATLPVTSLVCEVGKYYRLDVPVGTLAVTLPSMSNVTTVKTVVLYLIAGTTPAVTISAADSKDVLYQDGFGIESGKTYEINALYNGAAWIIAAVKIVVPVVEEEEEGGE